MSLRPFPISACCGLAAAIAGLATAPLAAAADAKVDVSKLPPVATKPGLSFAKDIQPLFEASCVKCHSGAKAKGKLRLDTLDGALHSGESKTRVIQPGKSAESPLVHFIADLVPDMEMPPTDKRDKFPGLTKEQVGLVRAWIDQGAK